MIYLGTLGRMVPVGCVADQRVVSADRYAFQTTLEGRVKAQARPVGRRVWDLRLPQTSTPTDLAQVEAFAHGGWGPGPFRFVPTEAPITNLLPPDVAACKSHENPSVVIMDGGPMVQPDGSWSPSSYMNPNPSLTMFFGVADGPGFGPGHAIPVLPGGVVTAAVTLLGEAANVTLRFYDAADVNISTFESPVQATAGTPVRSFVTGQVPSRAVACRITARNTVQGSMPQVTWTNGPVDWSGGRGCKAAVVLGGSRDLVMSGHRGSDRTYEGLDFSVQEVG